MQSAGIARQNLIVTMTSGERHEWIIGKAADQLRNAILERL